MQVITIGKNEYTAERTEHGEFLLWSPLGTGYTIFNGMKPLDPSKRYYAHSLTGGRMTYRGNPRLFTVDEEGNLILAN
jgi:hypothetical protein